MTESARFWSKVSVADGCWLWRAGKFSNGYGAFKRRVDGTWRQQKAHRIAYEYTHGFLPADLFVCHRCDTPACVRPDHLFLGTCVDNQRDMAVKGRASHHRLLPPGERARRAAAKNRAYRIAHKDHLAAYQRARWLRRKAGLCR